MRALELPAPQTGRIASTWYSPSSETLHVVTTDNQPHTVALYLLDWDNSGCSETITAQTPTGTVLDPARPFSSFVGGVYAVYQICGSVDFVVANRPGGLNGVVSGVFCGPPPSAQAGAPTVTNMLVDASGGLSQVVAETDGTGALTAYYVRVGDELLSVMRPTSGSTWTTRFVHHDALGSVRGLTDETGIAADTRGYEAIGTMNVEAGSDPLPYRFAGEAFDATSKLAYHRARWMDARVGRFVRTDRTYGCPNDRCGGYVYGNNNPGNLVDPTGAYSLGEGIAIGSIVAVLATTAYAVHHYLISNETDHGKYTSDRAAAKHYTIPFPQIT